LRGYEGTVRDEPATLTEARTAATADAAFGADMYQVLAEDAADTVFSPASVAGALRMALSGARGQTAAELARALHLDGSPGPDVAASGLHLALSGQRPADGHAGSADGEARGGPGEAVTLRAPNMVWVQSGLALRAEFTARLSRAAAALAEADFATAPEAARAEINRVIAAQTEGKITGLLPPAAVDPLTRLVLASAVYLKAAWAQPFPESATADAPFYPEGPDRPALTVPMMRRTGPLAYLRGDGYQAVLLPYRDIGLAMAVVLPDGPMAALRPKAAAAGLSGLLAGASRHRVALSLPRFRLEASFDLIPVLRRLGVTAAFGNRADFGGITDTVALKIGAVAHKAHIDVDEHGTEAAAATAVLAVALSAFATPPVTMTVDRPFLFAIVDTGTGLPLFLGQLSRPTVTSPDC
jgi:serpin B